MPIQLPAIDDRRYEQLVQDALARVAIHAPEWTHSGPSDPGVTLVELFAFMAESLLYRANLIPERNRLKFLQLLDIPLRPASPAHGLVQLRNDAGARVNVTRPAGDTYFAGALPFVSDAGLDIPPIEGLAVIKRLLVNTDQTVIDYYRQLYEATGRDFATLSADETTVDGASIEPVLYETVALDDLPAAVDLASEAVDGALWIALLAAPQAGDAERAAVRAELAGRTLSIGLVPAHLDEPAARLIPGSPATPPPSLSVRLPQAHPGSTQYARLAALSPDGFPERAGVLQVTLPLAEALLTWSDDEPLEAGVGDRPPLLDDDEVNARLLTWLRIDGLANAGVRLRWAGVHCVPVSQRHRVARELLAPGDGEVDQRRQLSHGQVLAASVLVLIDGEPWTLTDELAAAPAEGQPGATVFALDAEAGLLRFGDGVHGARPAANNEIAAAYDWSAGAAGNVAAGAIKLAPNLPPGFKLSNPLPCSGGTDAESVAEAEKRIPLVLRHRDRAVSADDFVEVLKAAPGADVGRVEILAAWHPELSPALPGDQPGVVTALIIPRRDPRHPETPRPDADFIDALCRHLAPRRLVTCEVLLRAPVYRGVWISVGIEIVAGQSVANVREAVRSALLRHLSPLPPAITGAPPPSLRDLENGWPLFRAVGALELATIVARTPGVAGVSGLLLGDAGGSPRDSVAMHGLQLPYIAGLAVSLGDPIPLDELTGRGSGGSDDGETGDGSAGDGRSRRRLPVPRIPQQC
jgi:hypothetical protein